MVSAGITGSSCYASCQPGTPGNPTELDAIVGNPTELDAIAKVVVADGVPSNTTVCSVLVVVIGTTNILRVTTIED